MKDWSPLLIEFLVKYHPNPENPTDLYHDLQHTLDVAARAYVSARLRGLSHVEATLLAKAGILHDFDPTPDRLANRGQPQVVRTIEFLTRPSHVRSRLFAILDVQAWELPLLLPVVQHSEYPLISETPPAGYENELPWDAYLRLLNDIPRDLKHPLSQDPDVFTRREAAMFSREADVGYWGTSFDQTIFHFTGLMAEKHRDGENVSYSQMAASIFIQRRVLGASDVDRADIDLMTQFHDSLEGFVYGPQFLRLLAHNRHTRKYAWRELGLIAAFEHLERYDPEFQHIDRHLEEARSIYQQTIATAWTQYARSEIRGMRSRHSPFGRSDTGRGGDGSYRRRSQRPGSPVGRRPR